MQPSFKGQNPDMHLRLHPSHSQPTQLPPESRWGRCARCSADCTRLWSVLYNYSVSTDGLIAYTLSCLNSSYLNPTETIGQTIHITSLLYHHHTTQHHMHMHHAPHLHCLFGHSILPSNSRPLPSHATHAVSLLNPLPPQTLTNDFSQHKRLGISSCTLLYSTLLYSAAVIPTANPYLRDTQCFPITHDLVALHRVPTISILPINPMHFSSCHRQHTATATATAKTKTTSVSFIHPPLQLSIVLSVPAQGISDTAAP